MPFVHEDRDAFVELIELTADRLDRDRFMVEKDYWVTHALYALQRAGFTVWFKGGTSLSKGFALVDRFSEDLDIKLEHPEVAEPTAANWKRTDGEKHKKIREAFFEALYSRLEALAPFTASKEPVLDDDGTSRNLNVRLDWPGHVNERSGVMQEYVLLEIGSTRVTPHVQRDISSWLHGELEQVGRLADYVDNRCRIRCLHPLVTLIEKLSILEKRAPDLTPPERIVRHYEDCARIARADLDGKLPVHPECADAKALVDAVKRVSRAQLTAPDAPAFHLDKLSTERREALVRAHEAIEGLFFGPRRDLAECASEVRAWIEARLR